MPFHGRTECPALGYMTTVPSSFKVKAADGLFVQGQTFPGTTCAWYLSSTRVKKPDVLTWQRATLNKGPQRTVLSPALTPGWAKALLALHWNSVSTSTQSSLLLPCHRCQTCIAVWSFRLSFLLPLPFDFHEHFHSTWTLNLAVLCPVGFWFPKDPTVTRLPSPPRVKHQCTLYSIPFILLIFINGSPRVILFFPLKKYFFHPLPTD